MARGYSFARGDVIALALQVTGGNPLAVSSVKVQLTAAAAINNPLGNSVFPSVLATVQFVPASSATSAYWLAVVSAAQSYYLPSGNYLAGAKISVGGANVSTALIPITIFEPSVAPPTPTIVPSGAAWVNGSVTTPSGSIVLQWANALDATQTIFPAINLTLNPNVLALVRGGKGAG